MNCLARMIDTRCFESGRNTFEVKMNLFGHFTWLRWLRGEGVRIFQSRFVEKVLGSFNHASWRRC